MAHGAGSARGYFYRLGFPVRETRLDFRAVAIGQGASGIESPYYVKVPSSAF